MLRTHSSHVLMTTKQVHVLPSCCKSTTTWMDRDMRRPILSINATMSAHCILFLISIICSTECVENDKTFQGFGNSSVCSFIAQSSDICTFVCHSQFSETFPLHLTVSHENAGLDENNIFMVMKLKCLSRGIPFHRYVCFIFTRSGQLCHVPCH